MRIAVRSLKRFLIIALIVAGLMAAAIPALADYLGPDRSVSTWTMERLVCDYQAVYDPPGGGYYGCSLTLYEPPDGTCESNVDAYFTSSACGWPPGIDCTSVNCDVSRSSSVEGCNDGDPGCREVEHVVNQPPATVSGTVSCGIPGSGGWCRGDGELSLSGSEPLSGYTILALEGTRNGQPFACAGAACDVSLLEGGNAFDFWAISSWGDTSLMGSASKSLDSQNPSLSGSASGTPGDNGWYVSSVTVSASASDASPGSGLVSLHVKIDGAGWASYGGPVTVGEGSHDVELRAVDGAGNSETQSVDIDVDTQSPIADLDASPSFCPGCGQSLDITVVVQDGGSGIAAWSLTASGRTVASGGGAIGQTIAWDGGGLGGGVHTLELEARDEAGNTAGASFDFALIAPTPAPQDDSSDDTGVGPTLIGSPTPTASPTATRTPRATPTASTVNFGGPSTSLGAGLPAAPAQDSGDSIANRQSPISDQPPGSSSAVVLPPSGMVFGAAALALAGVATAIALDNARRRKEEEARVRAEMERKNAEAEAREAAQQAALAQARSEAEFNLILGQIWDQATGGQRPSKAWLASKEAMLEPQVPPELVAKPPKVPPQPRPDIELIRAKKWAGYVPGQTELADVPWWEKLLATAREIGERAIETARSIGSSVARYGVPIAAGTLIGAATYQWARNLSSPDAFQVAHETSQAQVNQLLETYPDFLEPREIRQRSVEGHPYLQITRAMDGLDALTEVAASYIDAAWHQHPLVRAGVPLLRNAADQGCPKWNESLGRICGSGLYLGAGFLDQPADTSLGVLNGFVIHPIEGGAKMLAFAAENNAFTLGADVIEASKESGVNGAIGAVGDYLDRFSAMTADEDVRSGLIAAALLGLAFVAPAAAFVFVAGSTLDNLGAMGKEILGAPTWERAMEVAGSREARTLVVAVGILLALGTAKGVKDWVQWERVRSGVAPDVAAALERLPMAERAIVAEAASRLGMGPTELAAYFETASRMPGSIRSVFDQLPHTERLRLFSEAVRATGGTNQPVSLEALAAGWEEGSYVRTEAFVAADLLNRLGVDNAQAAGLLEWLAKRSTNVSSNGAADRVVIGRFFEDGRGWGYTQEARTNGGQYFQAPDGIWDRLANRELRVALDRTFIRQQMEAGVGRFDLVGGTIADILKTRGDSYTAVELTILAKEGPAYGYELVGESWVLRR